MSGRTQGSYPPKRTVPNSNPLTHLPLVNPIPPPPRTNAGLVTFSVIRGPYTYRLASCCNFAGDGGVLTRARRSLLDRQERWLSNELLVAWLYLFIYLILLHFLFPAGGQ